MVEELNYAQIQVFGIEDEPTGTVGEAKEEEEEDDEDEEEDEEEEEEDEKDDDEDGWQN